MSKIKPGPHHIYTVQSQWNHRKGPRELPEGSKVSLLGYTTSVFLFELSTNLGVVQSK